MMGGGKQQPRHMDPLSPASNSSLDQCVMSSDREMSAGSVPHGTPFRSIFGGPLPSQAPSSSRNNVRRGLTQGRYGPSQGNFGPSQGSYGPSQGNYGPSQGNYGPSQGNFGPSQGSYDPSQGIFGPAQGTYDQKHPPTQASYDHPPQAGHVPIVNPGPIRTAKVFDPYSMAGPQGRPNYVVAGEGRSAVGAGLMERGSGGALSAAYDSVRVQPAVITGFVTSGSSELSNAPRGPQNSVVEVPSNGTRFEGLSAEQEKRASNSGIGNTKNSEGTVYMYMYIHVRVQYIYIVHAHVQAVCTFYCTHGCSIHIHTYIYTFTCTCIMTSHKIKVTTGCL